MCRDNRTIWVHRIFHNHEQKLPWGQGSQSSYKEPRQKDMDVMQRGAELCGVLTVYLAEMEENRSNYLRDIVQLFGMNSFTLKGNQILNFRH